MRIIIGDREGNVIEVQAVSKPRHWGLGMETRRCRKNPNEVTIERGAKGAAKLLAAR